MKLISLLVVAATALADVQQVETEQQFVQGVQVLTWDLFWNICSCVNFTFIF